MTAPISPSATTPNVALLRQTMDQILAHPELHIQQVWAYETECGTAYCFAGWACKLSGLEVDRELLALGWDTRLANGESFADGAAHVLRIDQATAGCLFDADNSTADLKHYVDEICEHGLIRGVQDPWPHRDVLDEVGF